MKYARYDEKTNEILGYYDDEIHESIPTPSVSVSDEIWHRAVQTNATHIDPLTLELSVKERELDIEELRLAKLNELQNWASLMAEKSRIDLKNFGAIDGGYEYLTNAAVMKNNYEWLPKKEFRMHNDEFVPVTLQDLERIEKAIGIAGIFLKNLKWQYESAISKAKSKEELEAISFSQTIEIDLDKDNK